MKRVLLLLFATLFVVIAAYSESSEGGADNFVHYRISKYAFKYPHLFLDLWGKPLFNVLSSVFAQFGYIGIEIFNIIIAILTTVLGYRILGKFGKSYNWKVINFQRRTFQKSQMSKVIHFERHKTQTS